MKKILKVKDKRILLVYQYLVKDSFLGYLSYVDISMGKEISICHTLEQGRTNVMCSNPTNGIVHLGHASGTVTLWSPNQKTYVAKMLCHRVSALFFN